MAGKEKAENGEVVETLEASGQEEDLDSIMQELESLEQENAAAPQAADASAEKPAAATAKENASAGDGTIPFRGAKRKVNPVHGAGSTQSLTLELTGTLNLKLGFVTGSKSVELVCTEEALVCRFGDGTEVRIPTDNPRAATYKRSA